MDILLVNRKFASENPELVKLVVRGWFETLGIYGEEKTRLESDIMHTTKLSRGPGDADAPRCPVDIIPREFPLVWAQLILAHGSPELIESISSTVNILVESGDFSENPLPDGDPYTVVNSGFIGALEKDSFQKSVPGGLSGDSLRKKFSRLSDAQWEGLRVVGSLRLRPVSFRSGTESLDDNGKEQVKLIVNSIRHYPNYRILVKGHTGLRGDPAENMKLSTMRATSVSRDLLFTYGIDANRISVMGMGAAEPLPKEDDESDRSYNNRLKRVEVLFVTGM